MSEVVPFKINELEKIAEWGSACHLQVLEKLFIIENPGAGITVMRELAGR